MKGFSALVEYKKENIFNQTFKLMLDTAYIFIMEYA